MPSRADSPRRTVELVLRLVALAAALVLAARAWSARDQGNTVVVERTVLLDTALARWTTEAPAHLHLRVGDLPTRAQRDWLVALRRAGTPVSWQLADGAPATGMVVEAQPSPARESRLALVAPPGSVARLRDRLGTLDSLSVGESRVSSFTGAITGAVQAHLPGASLVSAARESLLVRPVLVTGAAGWETKFVVAALEEAGWEVRTRIAVAPGARVGPGADARLDTARLSAVVVLDSVAVPDAAMLRRFVESGGGAVFAGTASLARAHASLLPASAPRRDPGLITPPLPERPRAHLAAWAFQRLSGDAVSLEERAGRSVLAARRLGAGRVFQSGYDETWRWRMTGEGDEAPAAHRAWWSALTSAVAYAPPLGQATPWLDEAPLAAAVSALGEPAPAASGAPPGARRIPDAWLFAVLLLALLAEWISRRLRGAR